MFHLYRELISIPEARAGQICAPRRERERTKGPAGRKRARRSSRKKKRSARRTRGGVVWRVHVDLRVSGSTPTISAIYRRRYAKFPGLQSYTRGCTVYIYILGVYGESRVIQEAFTFFYGFELFMYIRICLCLCIYGWRGFLRQLPQSE